MGDVIQFPTKRGNAALHMEAKFNYDTNPEELTLNIRMARIKESLSRINELMRGLKEVNNVKPKE